MLIIRKSKRAENDKIISKLIEMGKYFRDNCPFLPNEGLFEAKASQPSLDEVKRRDAIFIVQGQAKIIEYVNKNETINLLEEGDFGILNPFSKTLIQSLSNRDLKFISFGFLGSNKEIRIS